MDGARDFRPGDGALARRPSYRSALTEDSAYEFPMGKGRFVNQKLGKRVSRKFDLLKSELAGRTNRKLSSALDLRLPKKGISREGQ